MEIFIPERYGVHDFLQVDDSIITIGFFDMLINGKIKTGYRIAALVEIIPSETETVLIENRSFIKATLNKGDIFLKDTKYVQLPKIGYVLFYEMANSGNYPLYMTYEESSTVYDYIAKICGATFHTNHAIFEMVSSHLFRSSKDIRIPYRNTTMSSEPKKLGLHAIALLAESATGKIIGAYSRQGVEAALANGAPETNSQIEDILRT